MINSRDLDELLPEVKRRAEEFIALCDKAGIDVIITSTYRDQESQAELYARGRTAPGKRVTNAGPGWSFHNWRVAFDFVPVVDGKAMWDDDYLWSRCGVIGESVGLEWGGRWRSFPDRPHMQYTGGLLLADFMAGKTLA